MGGVLYKSDTNTNNTAPPPKISGILLAAGESRRMGQPKLCLPWGKSTLIESVVGNFLESHLFELIVVVGGDGDRIRRVLASKPLRIVENSYYREGMSTSIREGVEAASDQAEGYLIGLGDQPLITADIIDHLITSFAEERPGIAVCANEGKNGHPVIFSRRFRDALCALRGDRGGRDLMKEHAAKVKQVEVGTRAIVIDIDTPEDYRKLSSGAGIVP
jgi:molybdenum cofactor cytidylyltransferase